MPREVVNPLGFTSDSSALLESGRELVIQLGFTPDSSASYALASSETVIPLGFTSEGSKPEGSYAENLRGSVKHFAKSGVLIAHY